MARSLWGKVYFKDIFAGYLLEQPGDRVAFSYDADYIEAGHPAIAHTLPVQESPYISHNGLHPFFDNLVSEGWLADAQSRLLDAHNIKPFELLLAFGFDCAGAVWILDPEPTKLTEAMLDLNDSKEMAVLANRASLSGAQPKLAVAERNGNFYPTRIDELSTHIAKFSSTTHPELVENEYLTTLAFKALLPNDDVAEQHIGEVEGLDEPALLIKRFDRNAAERIHFEEFNQLLGYHSTAKYDGAYKNMVDFILHEDRCLPAEAYTLYKRILAGLLLGNTDMHFKNFAMFHTPQGLRLTHTYDQIAAVLYKCTHLTLSITEATNLRIKHLKPVTVVTLGEEFGLSPAAIKMAIDDLEVRRSVAKQIIMDADFGSERLKNNLADFMEKTWNRTFASIGSSLLKKR